MKKLLAGLLEAVHLLLTAFLFASTFWLSPFTLPVRAWKYAGALGTSAPHIADDMKQVLLDRGAWVAAAALILVALAGFLRGDGKGLFGLLRVAAAGATLLIMMWADSGLPNQFLYRPWNCALVSTGVTLIVTGFLVSGGKGGGSSPSKSDSKK